ncbi:unnamed protein product, partial [Mycolicibacterium thermoresistibile]
QPPGGHRDLQPECEPVMAAL